MAKKVLVFFPHRLHASAGGPYTYLYNLQNAFNSEVVSLQFLCELFSFDDDQNEVERKTPRWINPLKKFVPRKLVYSRRIRLYLKDKFREPVIRPLYQLDFSAWDALHFHEAIDLWRFREKLQTYKGIVLLTSHSPKPYHLELLEDVFGLRKEAITRSTYRQLEAIDKTAFSRADVVVAPCGAAMEAYKDRWPLYTALTRDKKKIYLPTGIAPQPVTQNSTVVQQQYGIPDNAFVVCFNGRHLPVKGYDLLTEAAASLLPRISELWFLVTGKKDNPTRITHPRWIETGWTDHPQNIMSAANVVVIPNRETYFDLNLLQALSLGKPLLLSPTGGNSCFRQFDQAGIIYFDDLNAGSLASAIEQAYHNRHRLEGFSDALQNLFTREFSVRKFAERYQQFYLSI